VEATSPLPILLEEASVQNEEELRSLVRDNPVEEFGLSGPLLVVGRETNLASGADSPEFRTKDGVGTLPHPGRRTPSEKNESRHPSVDPEEAR